MGIFDKIRNIEHLNATELKYIGQSESSWHDTYQNSSYIYIGNLDKSLTEGDIIVIFSQFGEPIDINLVRDEETGESKGYCFLAYADQRSTILAVDNFIGYKLLERPLVVDHVLNYRLPKKYLEKDGQMIEEYKPTGAEGKGIGVYNVLSEEMVKDDNSDGIKTEEQESLDENEETGRRKFKESLKRKYMSEDKSEEEDRDKEKRRRKTKKEKRRDHKNKEVTKKKYIEEMGSQSSYTDTDDRFSPKRKTQRIKDKERKEERKKEKYREHRKHYSSKHKHTDTHKYKKK